MVLEVKTSSNTSESEVPGFSGRFNSFLDYLGFKEKNRHSEGADILGITRTTFRNWCTNNIAPRKHSDLRSAVKKLCEHKGKVIDDNYLSAWLLSGIPEINPFKDDDEAITAKGIAIVYLSQLLKDSETPFENLNASCKEILIKSVQESIKKSNLDVADHGDVVDFLREDSDISTLVHTLISHL